MNDAPAPKRQKTGNAATADDIAQANSTAQIFVGHRQNRWMAGFPDADAAPTIDTTGRSVERNPVGGSRKNRTQTAGTTSRPVHSQALVDYESPYNVLSLDQMAVGNTQPSLPSPALTEASTRSPNPNNANMHPRARPPDPHVRVPSNGPPGLQQPNTHVPGHGRVFVFNGANATPPLLPSQLQPPRPNPQPPQPQSPLGGQNLSMNALLPKLVNFREGIEQVYHGSTFIDQKWISTGRGRLALLEQALNTGDWFYIVLNQISALWSLPKDPRLPDIIWKVDMRAQDYLDKLLCSNNDLHPALLKWLSEFPESLHAIRASDQWKLQENVIKRVIDFCDRLPKNWDSIDAECRKTQAPPLTQDLDEKLKLKSPVLIATAFRSIARAIYLETSIGHLEELHKLDQQYFRAKGRRTNQQKEYAYNAFRYTAEQWESYENRLKAEHEKRRNQPNAHHLPLPRFHIPPEAISVFALTAPVIFDPRTATQQQAAINANARNLGHSPPAPAGAPQQYRFGTNENGLVAMPVQQQARRLFPPEGSEPRAQPTQPDPTRSALHQAHLRSPIIGPLQPTSGAPRLYRHVVGYALPPAKLHKSLPIQNVQFEVPQDEFDKIPPTITQERLGEPPIRTLTETSRTYRVRCAAVPPEGFLTDSAWAVADSVWPDELYLELNGSILEPRRKLHHGRYLPIDLTHIIQPGANTLTAIISRVSNDPRPFEFALSVEIVGVTSHESIRNMIPTISAVDSLREIKKSLAGGHDDEELAITTSNLSIQLFDPYSSSTIFNTPVRGLACKHRDCFDLETFLGVCKREFYWWPTVVDCWRCPICRSDVRPQMLVIDGFLVNVRKEMAEKAMLDTRAIVVNSDGTWQPKTEERSGERSESMEREEEAAAAQTGHGNVSKKIPEVIEIDD